MKVYNSDMQTAICMTDAEAEVLVAGLQAMLARRRELIAAEPSMASWSDVAQSMPGGRDNRHIAVSFSICGA